MYLLWQDSPANGAEKPAQKPWPTSTGSLCESLLLQELKHQSGACAWILQLEEVSRVGYEVVVETDQTVEIPERQEGERRRRIASYHFDRTGKGARIGY